MIEPRSKKTWVTTILPTDDELEAVAAEDDAPAPPLPKGFVRSEAELVGDARPGAVLGVEAAGEKVFWRLGSPPPLAWDEPGGANAAEAAKFEAVEKGVVSWEEERGEARS